MHRPCLLLYEIYICIDVRILCVLSSQYRYMYLFKSIFLFGLLPYLSSHQVKSVSW